MSPRARKRVTPESEPELARNIPVFVTPVAPPTDVTIGPPQLSATTTALEDRRERDLDELIDAIGNDGRLAVWHIVDGKAVFAGNMSLDGFSLDALLDAFGGGDKSLVFYQGKTKVDTFRVSLDPTVPIKSPKTTKALAAAGAAPAPASNGFGLGELAGFIGAMANSQMASMNMFQTMQSQNQAAFAQVMQAMTTMMQAKPERDPLEVVTKIVGLMKDNNTAANASEKMLDMFERGLNMAEKITPRDGDDITGVIGEGLKTLGVLIDGIVTEKKANAERIRRDGFTATTTPPQLAAGYAPPSNYVDGVDRGATNESGESRGARDNGASVSGDTGDASHSLSTTGGEMTTGENPVWLPGGTSVGLLFNAANWLKPEEAAGIINSRLSDAQFDALITDIETPGFGDRLQRYFPSLASDFAPNAEWIGAVVQVLLTQYVEAEEAEHDATSN